MTQEIALAACDAHLAGLLASQVPVGGSAERVTVRHLQASTSNRATYKCHCEQPATFYIFTRR